MMADGFNDNHDEGHRPTMLRPFAYDPLTRAVIMLEQRLIRCPACGAAQQSLSNQLVLRHSREVSVSWVCQSGAVLWLGADGATTLRSLSPCREATRLGLEAAMADARRAYACEEVIL
jgi:hypothetical protein